MIKGVFLYLIGLASQTFSEIQLENLTISSEDAMIESMTELHVYTEKPNWYVIIEKGDNKALKKNKSKKAEFDGKKLEHHGNRSLNNGGRLFEGKIKGLTNRLKQNIQNKKEKVRGLVNRLRQMTRKKFEKMRNHNEETKNNHRSKGTVNLVKQNLQNNKGKVRDLVNRKGQKMRKKLEEKRIPEAVISFKQHIQDRLKQLQEEAQDRKQAWVKHLNERERLRKINEETDKKVKKVINFIVKAIDILIGNVENKSSKGELNNRQLVEEIKRMNKTFEKLWQKGRHKVDKNIDETVGIQKGVNEESRKWLDPIVKENYKKYKWFVLV